MLKPWNYILVQMPLSLFVAELEAIGLIFMNAVVLGGAVWLMGADALITENMF
jgi:hypothetical protein